MKKIIKAEHLRVQLKKTKNVLVKDMNFSIASGESLIILGQSGSGKTMTCHSIMGLLDPKRFEVTGELVFESQSLLTLNRKEKQKLYGGEIAMMPQNPMTAFDPSMRIGKQMKETLRLHSDLPSSILTAKIKEALRKAGLADPDRVCRSYPHTLSGGMLQRVMIAMVQMVEATLVIADEPTTALDVVNRNSTVDSFISLREQGAAIILVTHDFSVAAQLGGMLLIMKDSEIVESGTVEEVLKNPNQPYTKSLLEAARLSKSNQEVRETAVC